MKYKIGIYGSSAGDLEILREKASELGKELAKHNIILITGACSGIPYMVAHEAAQRGVQIWGFSPEIDLAHQKLFTPKDDLSIYTKILYVPLNFEFIKNDQVRKKFRNVLSTATCDAGIIISGRWGSMNEFTNLIDYGKVVGILTQTGGIADEIPKLHEKIKKEGAGKVIFNSSPMSLVERVLNELPTKV